MQLHGTKYENPTRKFRIDFETDEGNLFRTIDQAVQIDIEQTFQMDWKFSDYYKKIKNNIGLEGFWTDNRIDEEVKIKWGKARLWKRSRGIRREKVQRMQIRAS